MTQPVTLNPAQANLARLQLLREGLRESYFEFFRYFWPEVSNEALVANWHIEYVCGRLQALAERVAAREDKAADLLVNVPPGMSKSTMCKVLFVPYLWTLDPTLQIISTTYEARLSRRHAGLSRDVIQGERYRELFGEACEIRPGENAVSFYRTTAGGFHLATSTGASITGTHAHVKLVDDAVDPKAVRSSARLEDVNYYLENTLSTREVDKRVSVTVTLMQRLHEDDPAGRQIKRAELGRLALEHVCLPATTEYPVKPAELAARYVDGKLDPIRLDDQALAEARFNLGSLGFAGQFGQQPASVGGEVIREAYFRYVHREAVPTDLVPHLFVDGAYTASRENDPTGLLVAAFDPRVRRAYILHAESVWMEMPELLAYLPGFCTQHGLDRVRARILVEPKAIGLSGVQMMRADARILATVHALAGELVRADKHGRAQAAAARLEAGQLVLVRGPWNDELIVQATQFPRGKHDEYVDLLAYAAAFFADPASSVSGGAKGSKRRKAGGLTRSAAVR